MLTGMTEDDWTIVLQLFAAAQSARGQPGRNDRKFLGGIAADAVGQLRAIADQPIPDADQHQGGLLLSCLHRYEAHCRPAHRLAQRFRVRRIVLAALDVRLDQLRCD
jgi:hypothetical protein